MATGRSRPAANSSTGTAKQTSSFVTRNRNVFIAECKIWRGPKGATEAIDQLLRYLVWRDSKAALVTVIKTADQTATIEKLADAVREHLAHILSRNNTKPSRQADFVLSADDEGRRVSLAILPVVVTP